MQLKGLVLQHGVVCSTHHSDHDYAATDQSKTQDVEAAILRLHELNNEIDWRSTYCTSQTFQFVCDARSTPQTCRRWA
jgi:hypothetical protein